MSVDIIMDTNQKQISRYYRSIGPEFSKIYNDKEMAYLGIDFLPLIVGITGPTKSGKTMVAKYLVTEYGFHYECLSSYIREKALILGHMSPNWKKMRDIAKQWRLESGPGILAKSLIQKIKEEGILRNAKAIVVDGVLHPKELLIIKELPNSYPIAITAEPELRYKFTESWEKNPPSWDEFIKRDRWECGFRDDNQRPGEDEPNINECIKLTPVENRFELKEGKGSRVELFEKIDAFLRKVRIHSLYNV